MNSKDKIAMTITLIWVIVTAIVVTPILGSCSKRGETTTHSSYSSGEIILSKLESDWILELCLDESLTGEERHDQAQAILEGAETMSSREDDYQDFGDDLYRRAGRR